MHTVQDFPKPDAWMSHRVSYGETDAMGVLYHAEFIHIFERSRGEFSRQQKLSYREMEARGIMLPVTEVFCKYRKPARYDDLLWVHVGISEWGRASVRFYYELYDESKTVLLADGTTLHAFTNLEGRPIRVPQWVKDAFAPQPEPF